MAQAKHTRPLLRRGLRTATWLVITGLSAGCTTPPARPVTTSSSMATIPPPSAAVANLPPDFVPVVRQGRYTLVELVPGPDQRDLMQQVVDITIPATLDATIGDALRYLLRRSGYRLCERSGANELYALPLPAADLHLGPLTLRQALLTLAGPAWDLSVDDTGRRVCFAPYTAPAPTSSATAAPAESDVVPMDSATAPDPINVLQPWGMWP